MTFRLSKKSLEKLKGVDPDIVNVIHKAIQLTSVDFAVVQGVRTKEEQRALYAQGRDDLVTVNRLRKAVGWGPITEDENKRPVTWTLNSKHIPGKDGFGHAVDLGAYVNGSISWSPSYYDDISFAVKRAARELKVDIKWAPDIGIKGDLGHYETEE